MKLLLPFIFHFAGITLFEIERNQEPAWVYQMRNIDSEIEKLKKEIDGLRGKAEAAKESGFADEAEDRLMKIERLERRIIELAKQKEGLKPRECS